MALNRDSEPLASAQPVKMFGCYCGGQDEGTGDPPSCWSCGRLMHQWGTRTPARASTTLSGAAADKRTENGGY